MTSIAMSVEEYHKASFEPDAEFVDGIIEKRPMGENRHSKWQITIGGFLFMHCREWNIRVRPELRTQTGERRYRVPNIAVLDADLPEEAYASVPPLTIFEILSPEDRLSRLLVRLADFEQMGVQAIYLVDPEDGSFVRFRGGRLSLEQSLEVAGRSVPVQAIADLLW